MSAPEDGVEPQGFDAGGEPEAAPKPKRNKKERKKPMTASARLSRVRELYVDRRMTLSEAARELGVSTSGARHCRARALSLGDDWDLARERRSITMQRVDEALREILDVFCDNAPRMLKQGVADCESDPAKFAAMAAKMANSIDTLTQAAVRVAPKLYADSVTLNKFIEFSEYVKKVDPGSGAEAATMIKGFVAKSFMAPKGGRKGGA